MATRKNTTQSPARFIVLNISNQEFKQNLIERINIGEELYSRQIQNNGDYNKLESDCELWVDYNFEMLKQVFNYPDNDYMDSYNHAGYSFLGQMGEVQNNPIQTKKNLIGYKLENLKSLLNKADLIKSEIPSNISVSHLGTQLSKNEVFIVHGHDDLAKTQTARFIEKLGLKPIILHEQVNSGKTIIEKIEEYSNVGFGIVLYTPCDKGCKSGEESNLSNRARQNVVFEHGYLIGKIGRKNVCALVKGNIETPNDISGVVYVSMDSEESWHLKIAKELKSSGYDIDLNNLL
jgi:predicted nucleotide-binding protein